MAGTAHGDDGGAVTTIDHFAAARFKAQVAVEKVEGAGQEHPVTIGHQRRSSQNIPVARRHTVIKHLNAPNAANDLFAAVPFAGITEMNDSPGAGRLAKPISGRRRALAPGPDGRGAPGRIAAGEKPAWLIWSCRLLPDGNWRVRTMIHPGQM